MEGGKVTKLGEVGWFFFFFFFFLFFLFLFLFLFFVLFCFFSFSLFKTTKICFGSTKMEIFYREKSISRWKKNQEKWLCPLRQICQVRPCYYCCCCCCFVLFCFVLFCFVFNSIDVSLSSRQQTISKFVHRFPGLNPRCSNTFRFKTYKTHYTSLNSCLLLRCCAYLWKQLPWSRTHTIFFALIFIKSTF